MSACMCYDFYDGKDCMGSKITMADDQTLQCNAYGYDVYAEAICLKWSDLLNIFKKDQN